MSKSVSYDEWRILVSKLESLKPPTQPNPPSLHFDERLLARKVEHLRSVRLSDVNDNNIEHLMFNLRQDLVRNLGNMSNSELYGPRFGVVPESIREYIQEVKTHLELISKADSISLQDRLSFLQETRHAFGRSALLLSGGGGLGVFHLGVVKALFQQGLLPRVIAGSSVGSIVAAMVATLTDDELTAAFSNLHSINLSFFHNTTTSEFISHLFSHGTLQDIEFLVSRLRSTLGDLTFQEAYERTGRILNVTVCAVDTKEPPRLLNYLTAPHALIWSAVAASSAFPGLFPAQDLLARDVKTGKLVKLGEFVAEGRRWRDGSLESDLPIRGLSELFNVNYSIVSQTNPHIVPLMALKHWVPWKWVAETVESEFRHRCLQWQMSFGGKWLTLFTQPWEGDVTMLLPMRFYRLNKLITNPTFQELLEATHQGEQQTWAKMAAIHASCSIERTLDRCVYKLSQEMKNSYVENSLKSRIPSWFNLRKNISTDSLGDLGFSPARSVNLLDVMLPLASSSVALNQVAGNSRSTENFGLDVIAP